MEERLSAEAIARGTAAERSSVAELRVLES